MMPMHNSILVITRLAKKNIQTDDIETKQRSSDTSKSSIKFWSKERGDKRMARRGKVENMIGCESI